jgi:hypothetical protein
VAKASGDGGTLSAGSILTKVAQPNYWSSALDLGTPPELEGAGPGGNVAGNVYTQPGSIAPSAGGTGGGGAATQPAVPDWEQALIAQGMPPALVQQIKDYYAAHADDPDVQTKTLALVRGSDWWQTTFAGFWQGYANGMFTDETGYRSWLTSANDAWQRYYGRTLTPEERAMYLQQGFSPARLEQIGAGHAYAETNRPDIQWETGAFSSAPLTDAEREAYGQEATGLDSAFGQQIKARVDKAIQTAQAVFGGTLATPNISIGGAGLSAPSLNPQPKPDISA